MIERAQQEIWVNSLTDPSECRLLKPRKMGITMVMDKGLGIRQFKDLLETSSAYIDFIKLGFGTVALYPTAILKQKIRLARDYEITLYPGGTFFEVAYLQHKVSEYLYKMIDLGFDTVEISDGTITLSRAERNQFIEQATKLGLSVITECGKKLSGSSLELTEIEETLEFDLNAGAMYMIIEGRESGENVGIYDASGEINDLLIRKLQQNLEEYAMHIIWETPKKDQQTTFILSCGPNTNLGNVSPEDIYSVEALRRGLRSDTLRL
jgi:phosphosulfolactate synthase